MDNKIISKEQQLYLNTSFKEKYKEYIKCSSKEDFNNEYQVWIYGSDTVVLRPFCIFMSYDKSIEIKIDLLTFNILDITLSQGQVYNWSLFQELKDKFDKWLENNWYYLYRFWDGCNENNMIEDYIVLHNITNINPLLKKYCED